MCLLGPLTPTYPPLVGGEAERYWKQMLGVSQAAGRHHDSVFALKTGTPPVTEKNRVTACVLWLVSVSSVLIE